MNVSFSSMNSLGNILIVTAVTAISLNHPVGSFATMTQKLVEVASPISVPLEFPDRSISQTSFDGSYAFIFHDLRAGKVVATNSDNPPPMPKSPGGSRYLPG
jgi:hypothetical protein